MNIINKINSPNDVKKLNELELAALAAEIRAFLIEPGDILPQIWVWWS